MGGSYDGGDRDSKLKTLTSQHQQEVLNFIEFLKTKEQHQASEATQSVEVMHQSKLSRKLQKSTGKQNLAK